MRRRVLSRGLFGLLGVVVLLGAVSVSSAASPPTWGSAIEVPGTASLNSGGNAIVLSVSCATAGNCAAGGSYTDGSSHTQAFVGDETTGVWGNAIEVPGTASLNSGGQAEVHAISCATAGNCAAVGYYTAGSGQAQAFAVDETNGSWGNAIQVPGTATLNSGGNAHLNSVSCPTAGNCAAGGSYTDSLGRTQAFVVNETNGSWGDAIQVPGSAVLNSGGNASVQSISCATAGNCSAGGFYTDGLAHAQAFVVDETNSSWGTAIEVPGTATLNSGGNAHVNSVSCPTAGNCAAGGYYTDGTLLSGHSQAFVVGETNGSWSNAVQVPGTANLNTGGNASVQSVACATAGNCSAGGSYTDGDGHGQAFVANETSGSWSNAIKVPGTATLNSGGNASVQGLSCPTAGNCSAGGYYTDGSGHAQAAVVHETNGSWGSALQVPATAALNSGGNAKVNAVSCASAGNCTAGGSYNDGSDNRHAFVVSADATPPVITRTVTPSSPNGLHGWYTQGPVAVEWSAVDLESGIASSAGCGQTTITKNTPMGGKKLTCAATNGGGLRRAVSVTIKLDATPPTVTCAAAPHFVLNAADKSVKATVKDANSGATSYTATTPVATGTPGQFSTNVTGTDIADNSKIAVCPYFVGFKVIPSSPTPGSDWSRNSGTPIPVAFTLTNASDGPISNTLRTNIVTNCGAKVQLVGHGNAQCAQVGAQPGTFSLNLTHSTLPAGDYIVKVSISYDGAIVNTKTTNVHLS